MEEGNRYVACLKEGGGRDIGAEGGRYRQKGKGRGVGEERKLS